MRCSAPRVRFPEDGPAEPIYAVAVLRRDAYTLVVGFKYVSDDAEAIITGGDVTTIAATTNTAGGEEAPDAISGDGGNLCDFHFADYATYPSTLHITSLGDVTFDRPGTGITAPLDVVWPPEVGSITSVTIDVDDPTIAHWSLTDNCVIAELDTSPMTLNDGSGPQAPINFLGFSGSTVDLQYGSTHSPGDTWECNSQPAAVTVPGGYFVFPAAGTTL